MKYSFLARFFLCVLCVPGISGCATFRFAPPMPERYTGYTYTPKQYELDVMAYNSQTATREVRTKIRNKIVYSTARAIDVNYIAFKKSFFGERAVMETSLDIVQIGLGSAGTLVAGESIKAILSAAVTGLSGSRFSFSKNFFKEKTPDLLMTKMDALRTQQWSQIYHKLQTSDDRYSLDEAERDLIAYYEAGSLHAAYQNIIAESGAEQKRAQDEIKATIQKKYGRFIGPMAPSSETRELDALYDEFSELEGTALDERAKRIIEEFSKKMPDYKVNPKYPNSTNVEKVASLYGDALNNDAAEVRKALVESFKTAKSK